MGNVSVYKHLDAFEAPFVFTIVEDSHVLRTIHSSGLKDCNKLTFPIYSLSKIFTSVLILKSVELNKLSLEDSINKFLDNLPVSWLGKLKIKNLLTHRSGLADYEYCSKYHSLVKCEPSSKINKNILIEMVLDQGQKFNEGEGFQYANIGYLYLEKILEKIHDKTFESLLKSEICSNLGLQNTHVAESLDSLKKLTFTCLDSPSIGGGDMRGKYHPNWVSHALITSSITDLSIFLDAVFQGNILTGSSKSLLTTSPIPLSFPSKVIDAFYGYGIMGDPDSKIGSFLGHDGGGPGYSVSAYHQEFKGKKRDYFLVFGKEGIRGIDTIAGLAGSGGLSL